MMETIQNAALAVLCFLLCVIFVMAFSKPLPRHERRQFDKLAAAHAKMMKAQDELAEELGAEARARLADNRRLLAASYQETYSVKAVCERAKLYAEIQEDEKLLRGLGMLNPKGVIPESYDWL